MSFSSPSSAGPPTASKSRDVFHIDSPDNTPSPSPFSRRPRVLNTYGRRNRNTPASRRPFTSSPLTAPFLAGARPLSSPLGPRNGNSQAVPRLSSPSYVLRRNSDGGEGGASSTLIQPDKHENNVEDPEEEDRENIGPTDGLVHRQSPHHSDLGARFSSDKITSSTPLDLEPPQSTSSKTKRHAENTDLHSDDDHLPSPKRARHNAAEQAREAGAAEIGVGSRATEHDLADEQHSQHGGDTTEDEEEFVGPPANPELSPPQREHHDTPESPESSPWSSPKSALDLTSMPLPDQGTVDHDGANEDFIVGQGETTLLTVMTATSANDDGDDVAVSSPASSLASFVNVLSSPVKKSTGAASTKPAATDAAATTTVTASPITTTTTVHEREDEREQASPSPAALSSSSPGSTTRYMIHAITDFRTITATKEANGPVAVELRVSWDGYPNPADDTWEDESAIHESAPAAVFAFWKSRKGGDRSAALGLGPDAEFDVLRVCGHRMKPEKKGKSKGRGKGKSTTQRHDRKGGRVINQEKDKLQFLVEWVGYSEKTWEPAGGLPGDMVAEYCAAKGLSFS